MRGSRKGIMFTRNKSRLLNHIAPMPWPASITRILNPVQTPKERDSVQHIVGHEVPRTDLIHDLVSRLQILSARTCGGVQGVLPYTHYRAMRYLC